MAARPAPGPHPASRQRPGRPRFGAFAALLVLAFLGGGLLGVLTDDDRAPVNPTIDYEYRIATVTPSPTVNPYQVRRAIAAQQELAARMQEIEAQLAASALEERERRESIHLYPGDEEVRAAIRATFPEMPDLAECIGFEESGLGTHPETYNLDWPDGGPMQLNKYTWESFFLENYGWPWATVVRDLGIHMQAARIVWERAGGKFTPWTTLPDCI